MIYWLVFLMLLSGSLVELSKRKINLYFFVAAYITLTLMLCLRQGQGQDYYNYYQIYKEVKYYSNRSFFLVMAMRDPFYAFLNWCFIKLHISYPWFVAFFSFATMALQWPFFKKICKGSCICLFVFYSTVVLQYDFNAMRQGMALAIMLGILFPLLVKRKYKQFYLILFFGCLIHLSILICVLMPLSQKLNFQKSVMVVLSFIGIVFILFSGNILSLFPFPDFITERAGSYTESSDTKILAIVVRILLLLPLFLIPSATYEKNERLNLIKNIIFLGFLVYSVCSFNDFVASRENMYFRMFEGYFLSLIILNTRLRKTRKLLFGYYSVLCCILFTKDISAAMAQGHYRNCNVFTYPYFTVFDNNQDINYYRTNFGFVDEQL